MNSGGGSFGGAGATVEWDSSGEARVLTILRDASGPDGATTPTLGRVTAAGLVAPVFSLEQPWRGNAPGISCVPAGFFRLVLAPSRRFGREMPRLMSVPGRGGILIHGGNSTADTSGCILVGRERAGDGRTILRSREALSFVEDWLKRATSGGEAWLRILYAGAATGPGGA